MLAKLLGLSLLVAVAATLCLSPRNWAFTSMPRVEDIAALPVSSKLASLRERNGLMLPYLQSEAAVRAAAARPVRLGFSYRELSILRLPLWAYPDMKLVSFLETPDGYSVTPIAASDVRLIDEAAGRRIGGGYRFPLYRHVWGWAIVLLFVAWLWARGRDLERRDENPD